MKIIRIVVYMVLMLGLAGLEVAAFVLGGEITFAASVAWRVVGMALLIRIVLSEVWNLVQDLKTKKLLTDAAFLLILLPFIITIGNLSFSDISPESALQIQAGFEAAAKRDLGYTETAFIGYPARQYVLAAVPSVLFGKSVLTFHLGYAYMFLLGMVCFFRGIREKLRKEGYNESLALIPVSMIAAFPFITEYYMFFEQTIMPVSLALLGVSFFFFTEDSENPAEFLFLGWIGALMSVSYVPALAGLGLLLAALGLRALIALIKKKKASVTYVLLNLGCFFYVGAAGAATFIVGRTDRVSEHQDVLSHPVQYLLQLFGRTFFGEGVDFWGIFIAFTIVYIILGLVGVFKIWGVMCSLWFIGVIVVADYLVGYREYDRITNMQRQMVLVPVLAVCLFNAGLLLYKKLKLDAKLGQKVKKIGFVLVVAVFFATGLFNFQRKHHSFYYFSYIQPLKTIMAWIDETNPLENKKLLLITDSKLERNIQDYKYFYPESTKAKAVGTAEFDGKTAYDYIFTEAPLPEELVKDYVFEERTTFIVRYRKKVTVYRYTHR
ncbi:MAG: hypothetical protein J6113_08270 [Lachnospiraceae bacterium]|nr:hypothetical protein [Lachnospiraceae bacterium]